LGKLSDIVPVPHWHRRFTRLGTLRQCRGWAEARSSHAYTACTPRSRYHPLPRSSGRELSQELFEGLFSRSVSRLNGFIEDR